MVTVCAHHSGCLFCLFPLEKISIHSHLGLLQLLPAPEKNPCLASLYICLPVGLSDVIDLNRCLLQLGTISLNQKINEPMKEKVAKEEKIWLLPTYE